MSAAKQMLAQFGTAEVADFEAMTWTFRMPEGYRVAAGEFAIVPADVFREMVAEVERLKRGHKALGECIHNMTVANQSAWIEWRHGKGAEAAMVWIHNGLAGPGFIPNDDAPYGKEAQAWYDANNADPLPTCKCGRPSNIAWTGGAACSDAHYREAKAAEKAATGSAA